jgi:hypothetical protein
MPLVNRALAQMPERDLIAADPDKFLAVYLSDLLRLKDFAKAMIGPMSAYWEVAGFALKLVLSLVVTVIAHLCLPSFRWVRPWLQGPCLGHLIVAAIVVGATLTMVRLPSLPEVARIVRPAPLGPSNDPLAIAAPRKPIWRSGWHAHLLRRRRPPPAASEAEDALWGTVWNELIADLDEGHFEKLWLWISATARCVSAAVAAGWRALREGPQPAVATVHTHDPLYMLFVQVCLCC